MRRKCLDTKKYWNQYHDVKDLPKEITGNNKNEKNRTCNITCLAMFTGEDPNLILKRMFRKYGKNDKFQLQGNLIRYLEKSGFTCAPITRSLGQWSDYPKGDFPTKGELMMMRQSIGSGMPILYHEKGHYLIMVGYLQSEDGKYFYIFNDPAGDRTKKIKDRERESGHHVVYTEKFVSKRRIYGRCFTVKRK